MEVVRMTFEDGHTSDIGLYEGATMPMKSLAEVMRAVMKPTPTNVEIVRIQNWDPETDSIVIESLELPKSDQ